MTIRIEIFGESASEALHELSIIAKALTGTALAGNSTKSEATPVVGAGTAVASEDTPQNSAASATQENPSLVGNGSTATTDVSLSDSDPNEVDAHGWPWSPELHASTKGTTKDGLWRMKVGVTRPDPKPGFPKTDATPSSTSTASPANQVADTAMEPAGSSPTAAPASVAASPDEDDEFAMFAAAAAKVNATEAAAAASVPARVWTDADLGALCNQAAMKLGDPAPIKEVIATFVPEGQVVHSRNVPADKRADFAAAIEAKAGIEFAG